MTSALRLPTLLLSLLLLAGCAGTTEIVRSADFVQPAQPLRSMFIAGVTVDDDLRRRYETVFVAELARAGVTGIASSTRIPDTRGLDLAALRERMHAAGSDADAVLHVQLTTFLPTPALGPTDVPAEDAPALGEVNGIALTINAPAAGVVHGSSTEVELQTTLYELPSRRLLWTVTTRTHEANDPEAVARSHARALIRALRDAGVIAR